MELLAEDKGLSVLARLVHEAHLLTTVSGISFLLQNHSRVMPFLLPPPEFRPGELARLGLTGTCELQICRSAGPWSLGTPGRIERSIQNAYLKG